MEFQDLANLRLYLREMLGQQVESLKQYYDPRSGGFYHRHDKPTPGNPSKSSTATCVLSLIATRQWSKGPWGPKAVRLARLLLRSDWTSAELHKKNAFTVGFIIEAVTELESVDPSIATDTGNRAILERAEKRLIQAIGPDGGVRIQGYPPSAYVTQLAMRALLKRSALRAKTRAKLRRWAIDETQRQLALLVANDKTADDFQLAYAVLIIASLTDPEDATPDTNQIIDAALKSFFSRQRPDGTWPLSRPLFHYPSVGSAHCFDYELLVQLLSEPRLWERLLRYVDNLKTAAEGLKFTSHKLGPRATGWSSGHHPQMPGPESWSTASVYHFAYAFERLLAEQIRRSTFKYVNVPYELLEARKVYPNVGDGFLDCRIVLDGAPRSLKNVVRTQILAPLIREERLRTIESGGALAKSTPMSMIFYGPPGTSKTTLAKKMAHVLGWPLLAIDASQFVKQGIDGVYAEADRVFGMLAILERVVVLLDEFDEMVRERGIAGSDSLSRFLTTSMLPKLVKINENRSLVIIVATNHLESFDIAIQRPGRFDAILQVMPPIVSEKVSRWHIFKSLLTVPQRKRLEPLTYLETEILANRLTKLKLKEPSRGRELLEQAVKDCILASTAVVREDDQKQRENVTWKTICEEQSTKSRARAARKVDQYAGRKVIQSEGGSFYVLLI